MYRVWVVANVLVERLNISDTLDAKVKTLSAKVASKEERNDMVQTMFIIEENQEVLKQNVKDVLDFNMEMTRKKSTRSSTIGMLRGRGKWRFLQMIKLGVV